MNQDHPTASNSPKLAQQPSSTPSLAAESFSPTPNPENIVVIESRKSAVTVGKHYIIALKNPAAVDPKGRELVEIVSFAFDFAEKNNLGHGYRIIINSPELRNPNNPHFHIHVILPGNEAERDAAPRAVDKWPTETH